MPRLSILLRGLLLTAGVAACAPQGPFPVSEAPASGLAQHQLAPGERLRVTTYGEPSLTGEFTVNAAGEVAFPLLGPVQAAGQTAGALADEIGNGLRSQGYLLDPKVVVEVLAYRPIYVLGEVNRPGEFPYQPGMTALAAIAQAEGFTYRARQKAVFIKRAGEAEEREVSLTSDLSLRPGDVLRIGERYF